MIRLVRFLWPTGDLIALFPTVEAHLVPLKACSMVVKKANQNRNVTSAFEDFSITQANSSRASTVSEYKAFCTGTCERMVLVQQETNSIEMLVQRLCSGSPGQYPCRGEQGL